MIRPFQNINIAFVQSCWHKDIVDQGRAGLLEKLDEFEIPDTSIQYFEMPGALEIPLKCKQLSGTGKFDYIIAAGFIVDGGIYRHEFVAQAVISALMQVQLECGVPILSMVLTPKHYDDSQERHSFFFDHFKVKGREIGDAIRQLQS